MPSKQHEELLYNKIAELSEKGWKCIPVKHTLPDAIALSPDGKLVAIEILGRKKRFRTRLGLKENRGWAYTPTTPMKRKTEYACYDDILFVIFERGVKGSEYSVMASEEWPDELQKHRKAWMIDLRNRLLRYYGLYICEDCLRVSEKPLEHVFYQGPGSEIDIFLCDDCMAGRYRV